MKNIEHLFTETENQYLTKKVLTEVKIPAAYFEKKLAQYIITEIESIGIFYIDFYDDIDKTKLVQSELLILPMPIHMCPSRIIEEKINDEPYVLLHFYQNDIFLKSKSLVKSVVNVEKVFNLLFNNYIPKDIDYIHIFQLLKDAKNINGINLKCSDQLLAILAAEAARNPNNLNEPFRLALAKEPDTSEYLRYIVRITDIARLRNSFMGLASSYPSLSVTVGVTNHRKGKNNNREVVQPVVDAIL